MREFASSKIKVFPFIISSILIFDQGSKWYGLKFFETTCNRDFAFGLGELGYASAILAVAVLLLVIYFFLREQNRDRVFGLSLILAGGISNIVDRVIRGCVVDFITFDFLNQISWPPALELPISILVQFPAFNLADAAIAVGTSLLVIWLLRDFVKHNG